ncbi:MAG: phosphoglycerate kinase [Candidatus Diapherotrites archaeon]|nr:phosphoglycerate kinase [Candidatus Diapherotrites archaeon]
MYFKMNDFNFEGKKVIVRLGADVPLDENGNITDDRRIKNSVPTIKKILSQKPKQIILICHIGRPDPDKIDKRLSTKKVAERLSQLLKQEVFYINGWDTKGFEDKKIVFLENLRFNKGEKSKDDNERMRFAELLAKQADLYVNDAFSNCHRKHASMYELPLLIPACASEGLERELRLIKDSIENPKRPMVSIIAGAKADKLNAVKNMMKKADKVLIGGALAFTLLKQFGYNVGKSKVDEEGVKEFKELVEEIKTSKKIILPVDCVVAKEIKQGSEKKIVDIDKIPQEYSGVDIGPKTIEIYKNELNKANTIVWNGPLGVFETDDFANGTKQIAEFIANKNCIKIVGGGDSAAAVDKFKLEDKMTLVSTGGGASLELMEGKELIAIKALELSYNKFKSVLGNK